MAAKKKAKTVTLIKEIPGIFAVDDDVSITFQDADVGAEYDTNNAGVARALAAYPDHWA
jgi:hypothetical protein